MTTLISTALVRDEALRKDLRMNAGTPLGASVPAISAVERAHRVREVDFARGTVGYEGGILSDEIEQLNIRYINGEISSDELTDAILASNTARAT